MILYSDKALERLGVSAEQMETKIADELPTTTEAAANSLVNLEFNLAHTGKVGDRRPNEPRRLFLPLRRVTHPTGRLPRLQKWLKIQKRSRCHERERAAHGFLGVFSRVLRLCRRFAQASNIF